MAQLLHGTLDVTILKAQLFENASKFRKLKEWTKTTVSSITKTGIYVTVDINELPVGRTRCVSHGQNPQWNERFHILFAHEASHITFTLRLFGGEAHTRDDHTYSLPISDVIDGEEHDDIQLQCQQRDCNLSVKVRFYPVVTTGELGEVPNTFFPQRTHCKVTLYQDADVSDSFRSFLHGNHLAREGDYEPQRCWEDIFHAITKAQHLVYISGWSVNTEITLVNNHMTLKDLLENKVKEKVQVKVIIWNNEYGAMTTDWIETKKSCENIGVHIVLCARPIGYTHHQKTIVVDNNRKIVSFLGGLDLCPGRYDTQDHSVFKADNLVDTRLPWHDIHCKIEGKAAWDVLENFEQMWEKLDVKGKAERLKLDEILDPPSKNNGDFWNVQIFRSLTYEAAEFPAIEDPFSKGLTSGDEGVVERSIQDAYVHAIRKAKKFIYIENQYFIGSSYDFKSTDMKSHNLIPKELTLKIVNKIKERKDFRVYVVIPMRPEGDVTQMKQILYFQVKTMEMMYTEIIKALNDEKMDTSKVERYLSFFCLGNRQVEQYITASEDDSGDSHNRTVQHIIRSMIYVHSKMMIVDDEYIIVGSANINERSMNGNRDTEIAMGAYETNKEETQGGEIHKFRMSLWHEHLREQNDVFLTPWSEACITMVNELAKDNSRRFDSDDNIEEWELSKHLLKYPIEVSPTQDGNVKILPIKECFPDTNFKIFGECSDSTWIGEEC